ncbi:hypothetical protein SOVF_016350 [Spinacia oleracea]|nr:hypothetical protein SOVF_016350 [Spinacia oleracea]
MASIQQADHGVNQLSDKEKAAIGEAMKEAESLAKNIKEKAVYSSQDQEVLVTGVVQNVNYSRDLELEKITSWTGKFMDLPPSKIARKNGIGTFVHKGTSSSDLHVSNSKGAIIYSASAYPGLGWLLAWDKSNKFNKVYVEAGTLTRIKEIPDYVILQKLDASDDMCRYWDTKTGASASAQINNYDDSMAMIAVSFDQFE